MRQQRIEILLQAANRTLSVRSHRGLELLEGQPSGILTGRVHHPVSKLFKGLAQPLRSFGAGVPERVDPATHRVHDGNADSLTQLLGQKISCATRFLGVKISGSASDAVPIISDMISPTGHFYGKDGPILLKTLMNCNSKNLELIRQQARIRSRQTSQLEPVFSLGLLRADQ